MTPDELLAQADFLHMSIDQISNLKQVMKARTEMRTGTTGDTTKKHAYDMWNAKDNPKKGEKSVADNPNDVPLLTRDIWHRKHSAELEETMWKIAGLEDVSLEHKQKAAEQAVESYKAGMQKDFDAYTSNQTDVQTVTRRTAEIKNTQDEWMENNPKDVSMFVKGDQYSREFGELKASLSKYKKGSPERNSIVMQMNQKLLKSNRYWTISKQYGIPRDLAHIRELKGLVKETMTRVRKEYGLKPAEKKKTQEDVVSSLGNFFISTANADETPYVSGDNGQLSSAEELVMEREGTKTNTSNEPISYMDSEDKLTGGHGHLMTAEEQAKYPEGTAIPGDVVAKWWKEDSKNAKTAAKQQAQELGIPELEDILMSVNFQLGSAWHTKKFPSAYKALKEGDYERAIFEIEHNGAGDGESLWKNQTPTRVADFKDAISKLIRG
jgi:hypothetical protein